MYISRYYDLASMVKPGRVVVLLGARQVGKTTLINSMLKNTKLKYKLVTGDDLDAREVLGSQKLSVIREWISGYELLVVDEAQRIPDIGWSLKLLVDQVPDIAVVVTGSSSFELAGQVGEPLTGRKQTLILYPIAELELSDRNVSERRQLLNERLVYGCYPRVAVAESHVLKRQAIEEITNSYVLKDVLTLDQLRGADKLLKLLRLVAFQVGNEVSLSELATQVEIDVKTVGRYLDILQKAFIICRLGGYSNNLRGEITSKAKYYFFDNGVRNALIANLNSLDMRNDVGQLWENYLIIERLKKRTYHNILANQYFWRTWNGQEIDLVEERGGQLYGYEMKWKTKARLVAPSAWRAAYPEAQWLQISADNYASFVV